MDAGTNKRKQLLMEKAFGPQARYLTLLLYGSQSVKTTPQNKFPPALSSFRLVYRYPQ
jgi:hypothetical protein